MNFSTSDKKIGGASDAQSLCGITLNFYKILVTVLKKRMKTGIINAENNVVKSYSEDGYERCFNTAQRAAA